MKPIIFYALFFCFSFSTLQAQCDDKDKKESIGTLITNTIKNPQADMDNDVPKVGEKGDLSKSFENSFGRGTVSGWLVIGAVEVVAVKGKTVTFKVLEEKSSMTINGEKKNHFEKGKTVKFAAVVSDEPQPYTRMHPNGKVKEKGFTRCGKIDGVMQTFDTTGAISEEINYVKGLKEGKGTGYHANGKVQAVATFKNDELEGQMLRYYPSGAKQSEFMMSKGEEVGNYKIYYEDGTVAEEGYKNETQNFFKDVTQYYDNGKKKLTIQRLSNKFYEGQVDSYNKDGILIESITYLKGDRNGITKEYNLAAGTTNIKDYKINQLLSLEIQDKKGNPISKEVYNADKTTTYSLYYDNAKLKEKGTRTEQKTNIGERLSYYDNGNLKEKTIFSNDGKMNGVYTSFHANGKPHISATKKDNNFDGEYTELNADNKPVASGAYADNKKIGTWLEYNEKGKKKKVKY
jgi:uncharacterized protein